MPPGCVSTTWSSQILSYSVRDFAIIISGAGSARGLGLRLSMPNGAKKEGACGGAKALALAPLLITRGARSAR